MPLERFIEQVPDWPNCLIDQVASVGGERCGSAGPRERFSTSTNSTRDLCCNRWLSTIQDDDPRQTDNREGREKYVVPVYKHSFNAYPKSEPKPDTVEFMIDSSPNQHCFEVKIQVIVKTLKNSVVFIAQRIEPVRF